MIDDQTLLWERLKDTAVSKLKENMEHEIGGLFEKHIKEFNEQLEKYMVWAITRYSTTEIRTVWPTILVGHRGLEEIVDYDAIDKLDEYLNLQNASLPHNWYNRKNGSVFVGRSGLGKSVTSPFPNAKLAYLLRRLQNGDARKMRRLRRKEAKLKKKGTKLFESI